MVEGGFSDFSYQVFIVKCAFANYWLIKLQDLRGIWAFSSPFFISFWYIKLLATTVKQLCESCLYVNFITCFSSLE